MSQSGQRQGTDFADNPVGFQVVMRFIFLPSKCSEYRALRAQSRAWALVWELGHGFFWMCVLSLPGVIAAWWVSRNDPEPPRNVVWSLVAPVLLIASTGAALKPYATKKGGLM